MMNYELIDIDFVLKFEGIIAHVFFILHTFKSISGGQLQTYTYMYMYFKMSSFNFCMIFLIKYLRYL